ncbi:hypothetical protein [Streptomyces sp. NRRL S-920]|uniref:hypothetical protein n=1 Tax=Streptomyces sp. NRRL S-920 TaxID=1463921 RepID=UPI00056C8124|nr:hypothetical protein [Streptomyces sp. NRRL S-920]
MDSTRIAQRFPLIARPRPACPPLTERVQEINAMGQAAAHNGKLSLATAALNKSALIASDCGLPDLARALCWRQTELYLPRMPLSAQEARYALEPLVNLARLHIRDGDGDSAYQLLDTLNRAVRHRADATVGGRYVSFQDLTTTAEDHRTVCQWLWAVLLGDGTRALVAASQWARVRAHVAQHKGVGRRLLDGRQAEIAARCLSGEATSARRMLNESTLSEAWEYPVAACLAGLCVACSGAPKNDVAKEMAAEYLKLSTAPGLAVFRTRVGLTVLDLSPPSLRTEVARRLVVDALRSGDGYVAREVLAHSACSVEMAEGDRRQLAEAVAAAGLGGTGGMGREMKRSLLAAVEVSTTVVEQHLATRHEV